MADVVSTVFCLDWEFKKLVSEGFGSKTQLYLGSHRLEHETFVAPLYWIRLDKLGAEQASAQKGPVHLNHTGLPEDTTKNGQRRDPSKTLAMFHRGLYDLLGSSVRENALETGRFENLVKVLEPDFDFSKWGTVRP